MACRRGNHSLGDCGAKFQGATREEQWEIVKKAALCKNCLKPVHIASKFRKLPMCKKCSKYHHTLLHMETAPKTEGKDKVPKDVTYAAPSKGNNCVSVCRLGEQYMCHLYCKSFSLYLHYPCIHRADGSKNSLIYQMIVGGVT